MQTGIKIEIKNKLHSENLNIIIYHHFSDNLDSVSPVPNQSIPRILFKDEDDHLLIYPADRDRHFWKNCTINLPLWVNFRWTGESELILSHVESRLHLTIPPGSSTNWKLIVTCPTKDKTGSQIPADSDFIIINEDSPQKISRALSR